eukprot:3108943-Alexandrium_andersonii.AAC.1
MSASLVGSEMCIRDRHRPAPSAQEQTRNNAASCLQQFATVRNRMQPVSYTHLTLPTICSV